MISDGICGSIAVPSLSPALGELLHPLPGNQADCCPVEKALLEETHCTVIDNEGYAPGQSFHAGRVQSRTTDISRIERIGEMLGS